ncbi:MAG: Rpn family recombination-promoting nuclease/putative transposase, partial [Chlamydiia bacterium]|nr:Rpn family recombination-promoting nuclease/putative transposase [Chlamydiia bacterium]
CFLPQTASPFHCPGSRNLVIGVNIYSFLNSVLGLENEEAIEVEEFLDPRKLRIEVGKPSTFVDLSVKTKGGERYIIEMQTYNHDGFDKRLLYYLGKDYTEQIEYHYQHPDKDKTKKRKKMIGWRDLPKVHIVAIIDFHRDQKEKNGILNHNKVVESYRFSPEVSASNNHLFDHWKATIVDLKKFKSKPVNKLETDKEIWIHILNDAPSLKQGEREALKKDPVFRRALERLEMLSADPKTRKRYQASVNDQRDHLAVLEAAEKAAEKKFRQQEREQIAIALLNQMLSSQQIAAATGLTVEEIESLANS